MFGVAPEEIEGMTEHREHRRQPGPGPGRAPRKVDDEGRPGHSGPSARQRCHRCVLEALRQHEVDEASRLPVEHIGRCLGGDISRSEAGPSGGQQQFAATGHRVEGGADLSAIVWHHAPLHDLEAGGRQVIAQSLPPAARKEAGHEHP